MNPAKGTSRDAKHPPLSRTTPERAAFVSTNVTRPLGGKKGRLRERPSRKQRTDSVLKSAGAYLRNISPTIRPRITALYRKRGGYANPKFNNRKRGLLAECVFEIENDIEHRYANAIKPKKPKVIDQLNEARNRLYDDLGWNEGRA